MKLEQSFEVDAPLERVWQALVDVEQVAPCLPGAAVTGRNEDGTYNGTFTIKIGPTTASYTGKLEMQDIDEASHSATMHAQGSDKRGQGGATATIVSRLETADGGTRVDVITDYHITGRLARFGRGGMIEDISERLLREFAGRLQSSLAGGGSAEAPTAVHAIDAEPEDEEEETAVTARAPEAAAAPEEAAAEPAPAEKAPPPTDVAAPAEPEAPPEPPAPREPEETPAPEAEATPAAAEPGAPPAAEPGAPPAAPEPPPPPPPPAAPEPPPPPPPPTAEATPPPPPPPPPRSDPPPASEPLDAGAMVGSVLVSRIKRNPKPVVAVVGGLLLLRMLRRRR